MLINFFNDFENTAKKLDCYARATALRHSGPAVKI